MKQRILTAGVLIAFFVSMFLLAPLWFLCLIATVVVLLASWEFFEMTDPNQPLSDRVVCLTLSALYPTAAMTGRIECLYGSIFLSLLVFSFQALFSRKDLKLRFEAIQRPLFGVIYIGFSLSHFVLIRNLENGLQWIFVILMVTYLGDTAALFCGKSLGRRKLAAQLSPNKTVEGAIGGLLASIGAIYLCKFLFFCPTGRALFGNFVKFQMSATFTNKHVHNFSSFWYVNYSYLITSTE